MACFAITDGASRSCKPAQAYQFWFRAADRACVSVNYLGTAQELERNSSTDEHQTIRYSIPPYFAVRCSMLRSPSTHTSSISFPKSSRISQATNVSH